MTVRIKGQPEFDPDEFREVTEEEMNEARKKAYKALSPFTEEDLRDAVSDLPYFAQNTVLVDTLVAHVRFIEKHGASDKDLDELRKRVDKLDANSGGKGKSLKDIFLGSLARGIAQEVVERILSLPSLLGLRASALARQMGVPSRE